MQSSNDMLNIVRDLLAYKQKLKYHERSIDSQLMNAPGAMNVPGLSNKSPLTSFKALILSSVSPKLANTREYQGSFISFQTML